MCPHPFFEAKPLGAAPGPPVKTGARVRLFRGCSKMAGGFGRKLGIGVKVLVAAHYVPSHYYFAFVDFERGHFM